jgi:hypothetical protein
MTGLQFPVPAVDPIPLPAPVWLFKALHIVTLSLHFFAVEMLVGGLLVAFVLNLLGSIGKGQPKSADRLAASAALAKRMPILMTFVINLAVPPLLFAQVLYGRALYTSSVLIGAYWISVIPLVMLCYWLLYRFAASAEARKSCWWIGLLAWLVAGFIGQILSSNMTLMLRPEVWQMMYSRSATGLHLPTADPTILPRWLFIMVGGLWVAGLWMIWISKARVTDALRNYLPAVGSKLALVGIILQAGVLAWLIFAQPATDAENIRGQIFKNVFSLSATGAWGVSALLVLVLALGTATKKLSVQIAGWGGAVATLLAQISWTGLRDVIRDLTLNAKGFDVWNREVATNWSVVGIFLVLFVVMLGIIGWLVSVMVKAKPIIEGASVA